MCSIAGAIGFINPRIKNAVAQMDAAQAHRGPDANGFWASTNCWQTGESENGTLLAHRRLAIIDLTPDGCQPMANAAQGTVIVFNGEIYNYRELRAELIAAGMTFHTHGDTEVILRAHEHWGLNAVERLRGMFAYALWEPAERRVLLVRDRLGIKPLYYAEFEHGAGKRTVIFSSELRAILASDLTSRRLNPVGLSSYIWNGFVAGPQTIIEGVQMLSPGAMAAVSIDQPRVKQTVYWNLPRTNGTRTTPDALAESLNT
ncbi:MAG TPA: hypothetical protein VG722_10260, partial [Tepidisphaeraceae bacterium]|nr:hypothetical protein [Tepidisphaeraceae bacterium]